MWILWRKVFEISHPRTSIRQHRSGKKAFERQSRAFDDHECSGYIHAYATLQGGRRDRSVGMIVSSILLCVCIAKKEGEHLIAVRGNDAWRADQ